MSIPALADLTREQRRADFTQLASVFWRHYGPYEWKKTILNFDLADLRPWMARVDAAKNDLEYLEICKQYTASFKDGHVDLTYPTTFVTQAPVNVDIYDGKATVESVGAAAVLAGLRAGDEILMFDGKPVDEAIAALYPYTAFGSNPRTERRWAANYLFYRHQTVFPNAPSFADSAMVTVRHTNGDEETVEVPFTRSGEPLRGFGELPPFQMLRRGGNRGTDDQASNALATVDGIALPDQVDPARREMYALDFVARPVRRYERAVRNFGAFSPAYSLPAGFALRRGTLSTDPFVSGVYQSGGKRIGYIRFPNFGPSSITTALAILDVELQYLQDNTDGLVIDVMRNNGGYGVYAHEIGRRLIPGPWTAQGQEVRATATKLADLSRERMSVAAAGAPQWMLAQYDVLIEGLRDAQQGNRARTGRLPINMSSLDMRPASVVYTKPLIVLIDEFSVSAGDMFPAIIQDANRGALVGYRTGGLGGSTGSFTGGALSESDVSTTFSLLVRPRMIDTEYGATSYIENVGVRPDIELDIMTNENRVNAGRPFVAAFTNIILDKIGR